ncbi:MFS transporter [Desulfopila aestuarii]|uniref:Predicted arabinose efflux permease, MFS family n=1 Tax=Desulfopila aestuarii DSM 18488 TaxID=1121416 RepID=A0A1M7Y6I4_9BACT|nr:MFS transporter [Desulfopila aestuarii]SHO48275.1 Predicted arabinose efflux permease, MFS family [Desulfopila aestuarii DSM 18488]
MNKEQHSDRPVIKLSQQILVATLCKLLLNTGRRFIYPFAPALSRSLEVPLTAITSIIAVCQFSSVIGIFSGPLADRFGYRLVMRGGLVLLIAGMLICGAFSWYWLAMLGLILASFGKTLFDPALQAYIGHQVEFSRRGRAIGFSETAWAGSTLLGIPLLGLSIEYLGLDSSYYLLAGLAAIGWLVLGRTIPADNHHGPLSTQPSGLLTTLGSLLSIRPALGMLIFGFCISVANDSLFVIYGAWFEQEFNVNLVTLGFSTVAIGLAELLGESGTALLADKLGLKRSIFTGLILVTVAYSLLPFIGVSLTSAMAGLFLVFLFFEFTIVTSFSLGTELLPENRATMLAGFYSIAGIGRMCGVLVGGYLWKNWGIAGVCRSSALFTVLGLLALYWGLKNWQPTRKNSE